MANERNCFVYAIFPKGEPDGGLLPICKLGHSENPDQRVQALSTAHYQELSIDSQLCFRSREAAKKFEKECHSHFASRRKRGEWFDITPEDVAQYFDFKLEQWFAESGGLHGQA